METIRGIVTKVLKEGSFAAILYEDADTGELKEARLSASLNGLSEGDAFLAEGHWKTDEYRGRLQHKLSARNVRPAYPRSMPGIRKFLDLNFTPRETGLDHAAIHKLCVKYGEATIEELFGNPELLVAQSSNPDRFRNAIHEIVANKGTNLQARDLMASAEFEDDEIGRVLERFQTKTLDTIMTNPYDVLSVPEISFGKVDRLGVKVGVSTADHRRIIGAVLEEIREAEGNGSSMINLSGTIPEIAYRVGVSEAEVESAVNSANSPESPLRNRISVFRLPQSTDAFAMFYERKRQEVGAAQGILRIITKGRRNDPEKAAALCEKMLKGTKFDEHQYRAVLAGVTEPISCIIGGPGAGKSTIMKAIVQISSHLDAGKIFVTATTGQASQNLEKATGAEAVTLHSLLGLHKDPSTNMSAYRRNAKNPLPDNCVVIVDEAGMADSELFAALLAALPPSGRLVIVGDRDQLLSVGVGQVLSDLQEMNIDGRSIVPVVRLVHTYRQDKDSKIVTDSKQMLEGKVPQVDETLRGGTSFQECPSYEITERIVRMYQKTFIPGKVDVLRDVAVISPQKRGPGGTYEINEALAKTLNPGREPIPGVAHSEFARDKDAPVPHVGDRVMLTDNDEAARVVNGDMGFIRGYRPDPQRNGKHLIEVELDDGRTYEVPCTKWRNLILAYAITCHKSQGSQYQIVILPFSEAHSGMADRNLVFTAWTRARKIVMGVGSKKVFAEFVLKNDKSKRFTLLRPFTEALVARQHVPPLGEKLDEITPLRFPRADSFRLPTEAPVSVPQSARPSGFGDLKKKAASEQMSGAPSAVPQPRSRVPLSARQPEAGSTEPSGTAAPPVPVRRRVPLSERGQPDTPKTPPAATPPAAPPPGAVPQPARRERRRLVSSSAEADNSPDAPSGFRP